jgi:hypothetical protein
MNAMSGQGDELLIELKWIIGQLLEGQAQLVLRIARIEELLRLDLPPALPPQSDLSELELQHRAAVARRNVNWEGG